MIAMVKNKFLLFCLTLLFMGLAGCSSDDGAGTDGSLAVRNVYATGCKTGEQVQSRAEATTAFPGFDESVEYTCRNDGYVFIRHTNALFNCCSEVIDVDVSRRGNDIIVTEAETDNSCNCICPFDVSYEIGPLQPGAYNVTLNACGETNSFIVTYPSGEGDMVLNVR